MTNDQAVVLLVAIVSIVAVLVWYYWKPATVNQTAGASSVLTKASPEFAHMTPRQVVAYFGLQDEIKLDNGINSSGGRMALFIALILAAFFLIPFGAGLTSRVSSSIPGQWLVGIALWLLVFLTILKLHLISVPEITGLVTLDVIRGVMHAYGSGWKIKYLWEQANDENHINMRLLPTSGTYKLVTKDGINVTFTYTVQYRPRLRLLPVYIRVDKKDIDGALDAIVRSAVSLRAMGRTADELRSDEKVEEMNTALRTELGQDGYGHEIEYRYGIDIEVVSISEPTFNEDYIESTTAQVITSKFDAAARKLREGDGGLGLSGQAAMDVVLLANKEKIERKVIAVEASDLADKLTGAIRDGINSFAKRES